MHSNQVWKQSSDRIVESLILKQTQAEDCPSNHWREVSLTLLKSRKRMSSQLSRAQSPTTAMKKTATSAAIISCTILSPSTSTWTLTSRYLTTFSRERWMIWRCESMWRRCCSKKWENRPTITIRSYRILKTGQTRSTTQGNRTRKMSDQW